MQANLSVSGNALRDAVGRLLYSTVVHLSPSYRGLADGAYSSGRPYACWTTKDKHKCVTKPVLPWSAKYRARGVSSRFSLEIRKGSPQDLPSTA